MRTPLQHSSDWPPDARGRMSGSRRLHVRCVSQRLQSKRMRSNAGDVFLSFRFFHAAIHFGGTERKKTGMFVRCMVAENSYPVSAHFPPTEFRNVRRDGAKAASQKLNAAAARDLRSEILDPLSPLRVKGAHAVS
jgi:hypothetical protein